MKGKLDITKKKRKMIIIHKGNLIIGMSIIMLLLPLFMALGNSQSINNVNQNASKFTPISFLIGSQINNANTYTIVYHGNEETSGTMQNSIFEVGKSENLPSNTYEQKYEITYNYNYDGIENEKIVISSNFEGWSTEVNARSRIYRKTTSK